MDKVIYRVVKHDGGWAYEANGTYSEPFRTREAARKAAKLAACEQRVPARPPGFHTRTGRDDGTTRSTAVRIARRLLSKIDELVRQSKPRRSPT